EEKKIYFGEFSLILNDVSFLENSDDTNYLKIFEKIFGKKTKSQMPIELMALVANDIGFEGALDKNIPIGILKSDGFYHPAMMTNKYGLMHFLSGNADVASHTLALKEVVKERFSNYPQDHITIRYLDFFAPEYDNSSYIGGYRNNLDKRLEFYKPQTEAIFQAFQELNYQGKISLMAPNVHSYEEVESIYTIFDSVRQKYETKNSGFKVSLSSKIETIDAAKDIYKLAKKFDITFEFGDLAAAFYNLPRTDANAISAFEKEKGFNPFKTVDTEFVNYIRNLVKEAKSARKTCKMAFGGDQLNYDYKLVKLAVEEGVDICITPSNKFHAAALFNINCAQLEIEQSQSASHGRGGTSGKKKY
ncbi:MAG TPA: hypothetical protein DIV86_04540, partial [Alphaproteobacteria bacterium]|nr:hypothetical protein [Alphaproteobacteria bacterium]